MDTFCDPSRTALEAHARKAHRAYIEALSFLEIVEHQAFCPFSGFDDTSKENHRRRYVDAAAEKERRRIAFRDLCDRLGYVVVEPNSSLCPEHAADCHAPRQ